MAFLKDPMVKADVDCILDCMSGSDGGGGFVNLLAMLNMVSGEHHKGNPKAQDLLDVVRRFANLVRVANNQPPVHEEHTRESETIDSKTD